MKRPRIILLIVGIILAGCIAALWLRGGSGKEITATVVGQTNRPDGSLQFVLGLTNHTRSTRSCSVGHHRVTVSPDGSRATNLHQIRLYRPVELRPNSGTNFLLNAPPAPDAWLVIISDQRVPGGLESFARRAAIHLRLLRPSQRAPKWQEEERFEVKL